MKTAVIYYSMSGNSEYVAKKISAFINADMVRLEPIKMYPDSGFKKFFWAGKSAVMGEMPPLKPYTFHAEEYDNLIFGFPVWASNPTPPLRTFIHENKEAIRGKKISAFACFSGGGADKALAKLKNLLEIENFEAELILIDPKDKPNTDNDEAISNFCKRCTGNNE